MSEMIWYLSDNHFIVSIILNFLISFGFILIEYAMSQLILWCKTLHNIEKC